MSSDSNAAAAEPRSTHGGTFITTSLLVAFLLPVGLLIYGLKSTSTQHTQEYQQATELFAAGSHVAAEGAYRAALKLQPTSGPVHTDLGRCLYALGRPREAMASFELAAVHEPTSYHGMYSCENFVNLAIRFGEHDAEANAEGGSSRHGDARALLQRAVALDPTNGVAYAVLGRAHQLNGALALAQSAIETASRLAPASAGVLHNAGHVWLNVGALHKAKESYQAAVDLEPTRLGWHISLALAQPRSALDEGAQRRRAGGGLRGALKLATGGEAAETTAFDDLPRAAEAVSLLNAADCNIHSSRSSHHSMASTTAGKWWRRGGSSSKAPAPAADVSDDSMRCVDGIAEALRTRGFAVCDNVLGPGALGGLQRAAEEMRMQMQEGVVGDLAMVNSTHRAKSRVDGRTRSDVTSRLPLTEPKAWRAQIGEYSHELRTGLKALQALLLEQLYPRLLHALPPERPPLWPKEKLQFACYTTGAFYRRHPDTMPRRETGASAREYTVIYYPNRAAWPPEDGGMLKLWLPPREEAEEEEQQEEVLVAPAGDRLLVFKSTLDHEVLQNHAAVERCAFTQWFWNVHDS